MKSVLIVAVIFGLLSCSPTATTRVPPAPVRPTEALTYEYPNPPSGGCPVPSSEKDSIGLMPPNPGGQLNAVDASDASDVWAAGSWQGCHGNEHSLVEHFDGSSWRVVKVPDVGSLSSIAIAGTNDVWAMGDERLLHWDGSSWSVSDTAQAPGGYSLDPLSATSPADVWLVGSQKGPRIHANTFGLATLVEHWDGHSWRIIPTPSPRKYSAWTNGIVAISPNNVWIGGYYETKPDHDYTLTMHWDGTRFRTVPSPNESSMNVLWGMGADESGKGVWAVGSDEIQRHAHSLFMRWTGSKWKLVGPTKDPFWAPTAVTGSSASDFWFIGSEPTSSLAIARWDGHRLSQTVAPPSGRGDPGELDGVIALSPSDAWAVGIQPQSSPRIEPLIEHWNGTRWEVFSSPVI